ncbi:MAG: alcohol dehydrogenase [Curvibacter sp. PD_MW3]|nr:MAG: alcohol dehydrogenase [Curvibacter sp. PD_MW3]
MNRAWRQAHRGRLLPVLALLLLLGGVLAWLNWPSAPIAVRASATPPATDSTTVERGRYLATLGNCQLCHTPRGGVPYAGGRGIATPFGTIFSSNLTPSPAGLGAWSADDFWRALHHGQSRDGRWLYPAFPYNNTTHITRPDSDALYAYLRSLPPQATPTPAHQLDWPYSTQVALKVWRALYFEEGSTTPTAERDGDLEVQRGAYLVRGLGHCSACHAPRNALGASSNMLDLAGGLIPVQNWYAPSLTNPAEAGVQDWTLDDIVALFQSGRAGNALVTGPMAEVVQHSTQHWSAADLRAMALYLKQLPRTDTPVASTTTASARLKGAGEQLYDKRCAQCHGEQGEGRRGTDGRLAYPPLAGNRAVTMASPANLVQIVLNGGFAPATPGHPRPFGMPPFVLNLSDGDVATLLTYIRTQWGNQAAPVSTLDVQQLRGTSAR